MAGGQSGELGDLVDADPGGAQHLDVLAGAGGVDVGLPAAEGALAVHLVAGGGIGGGALWAAALVADVGGAGAVLVLGARVAAVALRAGFGPGGAGLREFEAAQLLGAGVSVVVVFGHRLAGVSAGEAAGGADAGDAHVPAHLLADLAAQVVAAEAGVVWHVAGAVLAAHGADRTAGLEPAVGVDVVDRLGPAGHAGLLLGAGARFGPAGHARQLAPSGPGVVVGVFDRAVVAVADLAFPVAVQARAPVDAGRRRSCTRRGSGRSADLRSG